MIGAVLDKYQVEQKIGEGGMATVYRGRHCTLGRDVAIKVLHPHLSSSPRNRQRFAREARAIEQLRHPHILEIFDYSGSDSKDCYIITEYVEGETLTSLVQRCGPLPSEVVALVGLQLCDALAYAHGAGILHRDLKPDNVMIRGDGAIKLMDFGIARFLDESQVTMTGALVGSPAFMSPEQAREGVLDARSDLFSLGTLLFYLVSGHLPFAGSNPSLILKNIIEGNRPSLADLVPTVSASLADIVERLLHPDREERYSSASGVAEHLLDVLAETRIPLDAAVWSLGRYVADSTAYTERLEEHLGAVLLEEGRRQLDLGDPLAALRLLNRLLCMDPENSDVLTLVQSMHAEPPPSARTSRAAPALLGLLCLSLGAGALLWLSTPPEPAPVEDDGAESPPPPPPSVVVTSPPPPPRAVVIPERDLAVQVPRKPVRSPTPITPPKPVQAPPVATPTGPGFVEIRVEPPFWGDIYEGNQQLGSTRDRDPIPLSEGHHVLTVRNPLMEDLRLELDVVAGETISRRGLHLSPRPAEVRFPSTLDETCELVVDGSARGTLAQSGHRTSLANPDEPHVLVLTCGEHVYTQRYAELMSPVVVFEATPSP